MKKILKAISDIWNFILFGEYAEPSADKEESKQKELSTGAWMINRVGGGRFCSKCEAFLLASTRFCKGCNSKIIGMYDEKST